MRYIQSEGEEDERVRRGEHKLLLTTEEAAALRGWMPKLPLQPVEGRANEFAIEEGVLAVLVLPTAGLAAPARQLEAGGRWLEAAAWTRTTAAFLRLRGTAGQGTPGAAVAAALAARRSASADVKAALELQPSDFGAREGAEPTDEELQWPFKLTLGALTAEDGSAAPLGRYLYALPGRQSEAGRAKAAYVGGLSTLAQAAVASGLVASGAAPEAVAAAAAELLVDWHEPIGILEPKEAGWHRSLALKRALATSEEAREELSVRRIALALASEPATAPAVMALLGVERDGTAAAPAAELAAALREAATRCGVDKTLPIMAAAAELQPKVAHLEPLLRLSASRGEPLRERVEMVCERVRQAAERSEQARAEVQAPATEAATRTKAGGIPAAYQANLSEELETAAGYAALKAEMLRRRIPQREIRR